MKILEIENQEAEINVLYRASYEVQCRENIIKFMLNDGKDISDAHFKKFWDEYILYSMAYDKLKSEFQQNQILKHLGEDFIGSWEVDFTTKEIKIYD